MLRTLQHDEVDKEDTRAGHRLAQQADDAGGGLEDGCELYINHAINARAQPQRKQAVRFSRDPATKVIKKTLTT